MASVAAEQTTKPEIPTAKSDELIWDLRKYLLLLAILSATVTYTAGLNPPGGVWLETDGDHLTGNQILVVTYHARYNAFSYSNATAFMASTVVILLLLLFVKDEKDSTWLTVLRVVMALDMLALAVAYAAGASRGNFTFTTVFASLLVSPFFIYVAVHTTLDSFISRFVQGQCSGDEKQRSTEATLCGCNRQDGPYNICAECLALKRRRKVLMLLAIFAATITYTAGLSPPGGFWPDTQDGHHRAGDPVLQDHHWRRFTAFFVCNSMAFVASLVVIALLLTNKFQKKPIKEVALNAFILIALLGLVVAYAAGSCRETESTTYVMCLLGVVLAYILLQELVWVRLKTILGRQLVKKIQKCLTTLGECRRRLRPCQQGPQLNRTNGDEVQDRNVQSHAQDINQDQTTTASNGDEHAIHEHGLKTARSLVLLLATLAATVTYQAGLNPPGGFWPDDREGHKGGDPVLLTRHAARYRVFFYCNSTALAASLVVIFMVQNGYLSRSLVHQRHALEAVMVLDLIGLIGAYAAGSCRDVTTSIFVLALAGAVLVYVVFHMVFFTLDRKDDLHMEDETVEKKRKQLLLLAILVATLTYQAGLTPPGGFWLGDDELAHRAGDPVLFNNYSRRYTAFFYLNATSFMASVALTIILVNPNLYRMGIRCHALSVCMVTGLFGLMGAYAAGSSRHLRTTIYMIALVAAVFAFVILLLIIIISRKKNSTGDGATNPANTAGGGTNSQDTPGCPGNSKGRGSDKIEPHTDIESKRHGSETHDGAATAANRAGGCTNSQDTPGRAENSKGRGSDKIEPHTDIESKLHGSEARDDPAAAASGAGGGVTNSQHGRAEKSKRRGRSDKIESHTERRYLMLLGIVAASVTYQAGLAPPGGFWPDNSDGHAVGNPVLRDSNSRRYRIFFYSNSTSFAASIVVMSLLLLVELQHSELTRGRDQNARLKDKEPKLMRALHTAIIIDLIGLLGAYAAGSSREWETSGYVIALVAAVLLYIALYLSVSFLYQKRPNPLSVIALAKIFAIRSSESRTKLAS